MTRERFSALLIVIGLVMAFLPLPDNKSLTVKPDFLLGESLKIESVVSVDDVAGFVIREDSTVQLIDVRPTVEYLKANIPGSVNIPLSHIADKEWSGFLGRQNIRNILYSNGDTESNYAWIIAAGMGFKNCSVMKGGMNEWYDIILNSRFIGNSISPRENFLFETRTKAGQLFISLNSLPDSLKSKFMLAKKVASKKLDGGCE